MRLDKLKLTILAFLIVTTNLVYAIDASIIYGKWIGSFDNKSIELILNRDKTSELRISNYPIIKDKYNYFYGNSHYPVINIEHITNDNETYHLYLLIGTSNGIDYDLLRGFFEVSKIIDEQRELEKIITHKIDLRKID